MKTQPNADTSPPSFAEITPPMVVDLLMLAFHGGDELTPEQVEHKVDEFLTGPFSGLRSQRALVVEEILRRIRVRIGTASTLDDPHDHIEWLSGVDRSEWHFWPRLEDYLRRIDRFPPAVLREVDQSTDRCLERLEAPDRTGRWDRRGLVVGHVQSGKTTQYTSLAAKALDAGYEIVIVLAGIHNSLRSQTHERIDRHLIGRHSAAFLEAVRHHGSADVTVGLIGVGEEAHKLGHPPLPMTILTCTTSAEDGDFRTPVANQVGFQVSHGSRLVMVVKKNATILRNLINWLRTQNAAPGAPGTERRISAPTLVVDDEADHASINTARDPDDDPTTINRLIRQLLISFERVGFIGYTATPFANIFISADVDHERYGPDLFPSSFIVNLKAPSDYIGPSLVFGHPGDETGGIAEELALPMHVPVTDSSAWLPDRHRKNQAPGPLPDSLREAIYLFVITCAARACRGDENVHNSMLIHATRFVNVQARISQQIEDEINGLRNVVGLGASANTGSIQREMQRIWTSRIVSVHSPFEARLGERCPRLPPWRDVWAKILSALNRVQIMRVNGQSTDALAYSRNPDGLYVIAVGGDKLSRGLTLEGLSISYFLRTSSMFDTLMQMGRWFGYRPRYADLCRIYTTHELHAAFREIALAMDDLRGDLDYMAAVGKTPQEFGLRVRTPSDGLLITAANKIRRGEEVFVRFAGTLVQTLEIARTGARAETNQATVRRFVQSLGAAGRQIRGKVTPHFLWQRVTTSAILEFLEGYEAFSTPSFYNRCDALRRYIRDQVAKGELVEWTVAIISKYAQQNDGRAVTIGGTSFTPVRRTPKREGPVERFRTGVIVGLADEAVDLNVDEHANALAATPLDPTRPSDRPQHPARAAIRLHRPPQRGLLLLYLIEDQVAHARVEFIPAVALSFPESATAQPLAYTVNEVWRAQYGLTGDWNEDGEPA